MEQGLMQQETGNVAEKEPKPKEDVEALFEEASTHALTIDDIDEQTVELRRRLRDAGTEMTSKLLNEIDRLMKYGRNDSRSHFQTYLLTGLLDYPVGPEDSDKLTELLLTDYVVGDIDRSMQHRLLRTLERVGTFKNVPYLKDFATRRAWRDGEGRLNRYFRSDAYDVIKTLMLMKKRMKPEEKQVVDNTITGINQYLAVRGQIPFTDQNLEELAQMTEEEDPQAAFELNFKDPVQTQSTDSMDEDFWRDDDYGSLDILKPEELLDANAQEIIHKVNKLTLQPDIFPTALEAIQLHMFNYLMRHPEAGDADVHTEYEKIKKLSRREEANSNIRNPLPTIGIEIEVPNYVLNEKAVAILNAFRINNYSEIDELHEVNPQFSYSPSVQSRIIQELHHMGALPVDDSGRISELLSLHANFGMPPEITGEVLDKHLAEVIRVNDLLIYGFTSPERLRNRKTFNSLAFKDDSQKSRKSDTPQSDSETDESDKRAKLMRIELRANEFKDYPSFRMLAESQRLVAMLVAHIKETENLPMTLPEVRLAHLWVDFDSDVIAYLETVTPRSNLVDRDPEKVIKIMERERLPEHCRHYISEYSRRIAAIIEADKNIR